MTDTALGHTDLIPDTEIGAQMMAGQPWRDLGLRMWGRAVNLAPVSRAPMEPGFIGPPPQTGGGLKSGMFIRFVGGEDGRMEIGSTATVGDGDVSLFALIELGTEPHSIDAKNAEFLRFISKGKLFYRKHVNHPGTKKNPFAERACQQILHELDGLELVAVA